MKIKHSSILFTLLVITVALAVVAIGVEIQFGIPSLLYVATGTCLSVMLLLMFLLVYSNRSKTDYFCRHFDWHIAPDNQNFDGASLHGCCPRCGTPVTQDSQGNWYAS